FPIAFKEEAPEIMGFAERRAVPDPGGIAALADRAAAWVRLARRPAGERRVALVLSDYPARGGRAGYAVGLDTTDSALAILRLLKAESYDARDKDWQAADIAPLLDRTQPHLRCGNVIVLLQPDRGSAYHDTSAEPRPAHIAVHRCAPADG